MKQVNALMSSAVRTAHLHMPPMTQSLGLLWEPRQPSVTHAGATQGTAHTYTGQHAPTATCQADMYSGLVFLKKNTLQNGQ